MRVTIHSLDVLSKYGSVIVEKKSSVVCHVTVSHRMYFFVFFSFHLEKIIYMEDI